MAISRPLVLAAAALLAFPALAAAQTPADLQYENPMTSATPPAPPPTQPPSQPPSQPPKAPAGGGETPAGESPAKEQTRQTPAPKPQPAASRQPAPAPQPVAQAQPVPVQPGDGLPRTGLDLTMFLVGGLVLVGAGLALVRSGRRRSG